MIAPSLYQHTARALTGGEALEVFYAPLRPHGLEGRCIKTLAGLVRIEIDYHLSGDELIAVFLHECGHVEDIAASPGPGLDHRVVITPADAQSDLTPLQLETARALVADLERAASAKAATWLAMIERGCKPDEDADAKLYWLYRQSAA